MSGSEIDLRAIAQQLWERRRALFVAGLVGILTGAGIRAVLPERYKSVAFVLADARQSVTLPAGLSSLAGQLGIGLPLPEGQPPELYASIARTRSVLERVLSAPCDSLSNQTIQECLGVKGSSVQKARDRGVRKLRHALDVDVDRQTAALFLGVTTKDPVLSEHILAQVLLQLNRVNDDIRRERARAKREFLEERIASADTALWAAEDHLEKFFEGNRQWESSPALRTQQVRLQREVDMAQQLVISLRQEYEKMRLAEFDRTPVLTVVDPPSMPVRSEWPSIWVFMLALATLTCAAWGAVLLRRAQV